MGGDASRNLPEWMPLQLEFRQVCIGTQGLGKEALEEQVGAHPQAYWKAALARVVLAKTGEPSLDQVSLGPPHTYGWQSVTWNAASTWSPGVESPPTCWRDPDLRHWSVL